MQLELETLNISGLELVTSTMIVEILELADSLNELCLGVTYNQDEAVNILDLINSGEEKFYIDILNYYTICRLTGDTQATIYTREQRRVLDFPRMSNRILPLPSSSTWDWDIPPA